MSQTYVPLNNFLAAIMLVPKNDQSKYCVIFTHFLSDKPQISCEYNHTAFLHSEFDISCTVQSNPAPTTYTWRYAGDPMVKGSSQISSGYKVEDTQILYSTNKVCDQLFSTCMIISQIAF